MLDVSVAYNRYKFLGHEFLTWLWFMIETDKQTLMDADKELEDMYIGNRIVLANSSHNRDEIITIKGDDAGLEEGVIALQKGAKVTEINLVAKAQENEWRFNVKGESLNISNLKTPETGRIESSEDIEGAVLEKIYLYEKVINLINQLYTQFIKSRVTPDWEKTVVKNISRWIRRAAKE
ncbi:MAG: hypothetical protein ACKVE4_07575 [Dissulfuribacterales bacterium]